VAALHPRLREFPGQLVDLPDLLRAQLEIFLDMAIFQDAHQRGPAQPSTARSGSGTLGLAFENLFRGLIVEFEKRLIVVESGFQQTAADALHGRIVAELLAELVEEIDGLSGVFEVGLGAVALFAGSSAFSSALVRSTLATSVWDLASSACLAFPRRSRASSAFCLSRSHAPATRIVVPASPASATSSTATADNTTVRWRRPHLAVRSHRLGRRAWIGLSSRSAVDRPPFLRRRIALGGVLLHRLENNRLQLARNAVVEMPRRQWIDMLQGVEQMPAVVAGERRSSVRSSYSVTPSE